VGDAAHPMTWDRGQGACQGIEDAVLLAKQLAQAGDDPPGALRAWEAQRIPRTRRVVRDSRRSGSMEQTANPAAGFVRDQMLKVLTHGPFYRRAHRHLLVEY
jgi:FAD-dependent urate hydroxylase